MAKRRLRCELMESRLLLAGDVSSDFPDANVDLAGGLPALDVDVRSDHFHGVDPLIVDTLVDESDGDFSPGDFSLREAVELANANAGPDIIQFSNALDGGTIVLTTGVDSTTALEINDDVNIQGLGSTRLTVDASGADPDAGTLGDGVRIFNIRGGIVTISGLALTGGDAPGSGGAIFNSANLLANDLDIHGNVADGGGGIQSSDQLEIRNSRISGNQSRSFRGGGGVAVSQGANLQVVDSEISNNQASSGSGGGVALYEANANFMGAMISQNSAANRGGGIENVGSQVTISQSRISGNVANLGGGVYAVGGVEYFYYYDPYTMQNYYYYTILYGDTTLTNSTIDGNMAATGAGMYAAVGSNSLVRDSTLSGNHASANGGGIATNGDSFYPFYTGATVNIANSTLSGNMADGNGGGVHETSSGSGAFYIRHSTLTGNHADADSDGLGLGGGLNVRYATINHSIIAENSASVGYDAFNLSTQPVFSLIGSNDGTDFVEAPVGNPDANGNLIGGTGAAVISPGLGPLQSNGGPTQTHDLQPGSPAIDAGDPGIVTGLAYDQRGEPFMRIDGTIDMGAIESQEIGVDGDFNDDGAYDCDDIDELIRQIVLGENHGAFDLNGDGVLDVLDRDAWLQEAGEVNIGAGRAYRLGDGNLDGVVDGSDFNIWNSNKFTAGVYWCRGDFSADGFVDGSDFNIWNANKFTQSDTVSWGAFDGVDSSEREERSPNRIVSAVWGTSPTMRQT